MTLCVDRAAERLGGGPPFVGRAVLALLALGLAGVVLGTGALRCPTAMLLHLPCPACGTTRAARLLLTGDVAGAFRMHPVAPIVIVVFGTMAIRALALVWREGHSRRLFEGRLGGLVVWLVVLSTGLELVLWTLRWFGMFGGPVPV